MKRFKLLVFMLLVILATACNYEPSLPGVVTEISISREGFEPQKKYRVKIYGLSKTRADINRDYLILHTDSVYAVGDTVYGLMVGNSSIK